jgi:hypothetical protein
MRTTSFRRTSRVAPIAAAAAALALPLAVVPPAEGAHAAGVGGSVSATLLPVPLTAPGQVQAVRAVDVTELGIVAATAQVAGPEGTPPRSSAQRWIRLPGAGWQRQALGMPAGATSSSLSALTELGEGAGSVVVDGVDHAVRWSIDGRAATTIGPARSHAAAVGPLGTWGVDTDTTVTPPFFTGETQLVGRGGERTPLAGTPELDQGSRRSTYSVGGPRTALVTVGIGWGRGSGARFVLYRDGATLDPDVFGAFLLGAPPCASHVRADGTFVYTGLRSGDGGPTVVLGRHLGGVPGRDVVLSRSTPASDTFSGLACTSGGTRDSLALDGGVAALFNDNAVGTSAAYWSGHDVRTVVPRAPGESAAVGAAVATGGRMVVRAQGYDGVARLFLWDDGVRTPLAIPAGWQLESVVELTETGLVVANLGNGAGAVVPAAWQVS